MEDILASIKRIIADDQPPPPPRAPAVPPPAMVRTPSVLQPRAPADEPPPWPSQAEPPAPESVLELTDRMPEPIRQRVSAERPPAPTPAQQAAPVQRAVERLRQAEAEMPQPSAPRPVPRDLMPRTPPPRTTGGDITLEALVREMLQPMLTDWLDRNLPDMVERLVQAEIRRMSKKDG